MVGVGALVVGLATGAVPAASAGESVSAPVAAAARTAATREPVREVELITGERVIIGGVGAGRQLVVRGRDGGRAQYVHRRVNGDDLVFPVATLPYLGRVLDPALFNVSALARAGVRQAPVTVAARPGVSAPRPGPEFGAALARQVGQEATGGRKRDGSLFGGVSSVRSAVPATAVAPPASAGSTHALTVRIDPPPTDKDAVAFWLANSDDGRKFAARLDHDNGVARADVPEGNYRLEAYSLILDVVGQAREARVLTSDFSVSGDKEVTLSTSKATSRLSASTPLASSEMFLDPAMAHYDARGELMFAGGIGGLSSATDSVFVQPTGPAPVGRLVFRPQMHSESPAWVIEPYTYDVMLRNENSIPADQHYRIDQQQLTTVKPTFYSDAPTLPGMLSWTLGVPSDKTGSTSAGYVIYTPNQPRTAYIGGPRGMVYSGAGLIDSEGAGDGWPDIWSMFFGDWQAHTPGQTAELDFFRGPQAPGFPSVRVWEPEQTNCLACRDGDTTNLVVAPLMDSAATYGLGAPSAVQAQWTLSSGETVLSEGNGNGFLEVELPPTKADYKFVLDMPLTSPRITHSTMTHSEWTFTSQHSSARTVPQNWDCGAQCSPLSLLTALYRLDGGDHGSVVEPGRTGLGITFAHTAGVADLPVTDATVEVSFDGQKTWTSATVVRQANQRFQATWNTPALPTATDAALRIRGTDTAGHTLAQTITAAFTVAGPDRH